MFCCFVLKWGDVDVDCGNDRLLVFMWALRDGKGYRPLIRRIMLLLKYAPFPLFFSFKEGRADG